MARVRACREQLRPGESSRGNGLAKASSAPSGRPGSRRFPAALCSRSMNVEQIEPRDAKLMKASTGSLISDVLVSGGKHTHASRTGATGSPVALFACLHSLLAPRLGRASRRNPDFAALDLTADLHQFSPNRSRRLLQDCWYVTSLPDHGHNGDESFGQPAARSLRAGRFKSLLRNCLHPRKAARRSGSPERGAGDIAFKDPAVVILSTENRAAVAY